MTVGGIGKDASSCQRSAHIPIGIELSDGTREHGVYNSPEIPASDVPGIWGLRGMQKRRVLVDTGSNTVIIPGSEGFEVMLSPGSQVLRCVMSRSGHMLIPCTNYKDAKNPCGGNVGPFRYPRSWLAYGGKPHIQ